MARQGSMVQTAVPPAASDELMRNSRRRTLVVTVIVTSLLDRWVVLFRSPVTVGPATLLFYTRASDSVCGPEVSGRTALEALRTQWRGPPASLFVSVCEPPPSQAGLTPRA